MPIDYTIDRTRNLIFETWTGEVRVDDLRAYWKRYLSDAEVLDAMGACFYFGPPAVSTTRCRSGQVMDGELEREINARG